MFLAAKSDTGVFAFEFVMLDQAFLGEISKEPAATPTKCFDIPGMNDCDNMLYELDGEFQ